MIQVKRKKLAHAYTCVNGLVLLPFIGSCIEIEPEGSCFDQTPPESVKSRTTAKSLTVYLKLASNEKKGTADVVPAKDFKRRMVIEIDGAPHMIEHIQVQTPSARGAATLYKIKARNLKTKTRVEKSYRGTDALNESSFERRPVQYLYRDPDALHFMDSESFNQFSLPIDELSEQIPFMTENMEGVDALVVDDEVIAIELPDTVELPITETAPGVRGNSATGRTKPATLSTGAVVQVPEHLDPGATVRVDTRTGEYLGRAG